MAEQQPAREEEFVPPYEISSHTKGVARGEEAAQKRDLEPGRAHTGYKGARRPTGVSTPRDVTGINPEDMAPIDPRMSYMPPP
jgi:hypothetical protein